MLNNADPAFLDQLATRAPEGLLRAPRASDLEEPRGYLHGHAGAVAVPRSVDEVSLIVRACAAARVPLVPIAGGTGLVGGQVMVDGALPLLVSVDRLRSIRAISAPDSALVAEAGVTLADVQAAAESADLLFPLSLASEGSCRIGGNLATNAGGVQVLRYGNARDLVLGLEAVLPDGQIHHGLSMLRKDNTGYDLRHLLIGSEGTLGIITAASLRLFPRPALLATAIAAVPSPEVAVSLLEHMRHALGDAITAFELVDQTGVEFLAEHFPEIRPPLPDSKWTCLIEVGGTTESGIDASLDAALMAAMERSLVTDAVVAQSLAQRQTFWQVRETIPEANRLVGAIASHDISVPVSRIATFIEDGLKAIAGIDSDLRVNCFGHLGDGNLHYNIYPPKGRARSDYANVRETLSDLVHDLAMSHQGSFSAEHGVGRLKPPLLARYGDPAKLAAMRAIKAALDPIGFMNPGAVIPAPERGM